MHDSRSSHSGISQPELVVGVATHLLVGDALVGLISVNELVHTAAVPEGMEVFLLLRLLLLLCSLSYLTRWRCVGPFTLRHLLIVLLLLTPYVLLVASELSAPVPLPGGLGLQVVAVDRVRMLLVLLSVAPPSLLSAASLLPLFLHSQSALGELLLTRHIVIRLLLCLSELLLRLLVTALGVLGQSVLTRRRVRVVLVAFLVLLVVVVVVVVFIVVLLVVLFFLLVTFLHVILDLLIIAPLFLLLTLPLRSAHTLLAHASASVPASSQHGLSHPSLEPILLVVVKLCHSCGIATFLPEHTVLWLLTEKLLGRNKR